MQINEIIRRRRKELNLTQEQIASYLGVTSPAVHKWEKGISFPDVMLLPALARLLKTDLNTLFSFETELSEQEIGIFLNEVYAEFMEAGFEKGYEKVKDKIREFPTCGLLAYSAAAFLDGAIMMFAREEVGRYEEEIESWYERAVQYGDGKTKDAANNMLIIRYIKKKEFVKAEKLWETLPETDIDKKGLKATLCINQGKLEEAVCILEQKLYQAASGMLSSLSFLMNCFQRMEKEEEAAFCVGKIHEAVDAFGLWEYQKYTADLQMAVYQKDREKTLAALRSMFQAMEQPFDPSGFLFYSDMKAKEKREEESGTGQSAMAKMRAALIAGLKKENELDGKGFMQGDAELEELLNQWEE